MKRKTSLDQMALDMFQPQDEWPEGYRKGFQYLNGSNYKVWGFDLETEGLNPYSKKYNIRTFALSPQAKLAFGQDMLTFSGHTERALRVFLSDPEFVLVGHNIKFDINWIRIKLNIDVKCLLFDTMFAQYLIDENIPSNSLGYLIDTYLVRDADIDLYTNPDGIYSSYKDEFNKSFHLVSREDLLLYNCKDADARRRLYDVLVPKLKENNLVNLMTTSSLVLPILSKMETRGVYLDKDWAYKTQDRIFKDLVSLRYDMAELVRIPFSPDSSQDLAKIFYSQSGFGLSPTKFTKSGQPSTDAEAISYLVDQNLSEQQSLFIEKLLRYKKQIKLISTYYQPIERWTKYDGRVHANYSLGRFDNEEGSGGTVTGRLSCREPNLQNIPRGREHRGMFTATEGFTLLDGDFSQLELRVAAFLSQEPAMMDAFNNGLDIHSSVMSDITGIPYDEINERKDIDFDIKTKRVAIKRVNFGILYGVQAQRLQRLLRLELGINVELEYCENTIKEWLRRYPRIANWIKNCKLKAVQKGYVDMPLGQRRRLPDASFDTGEGRRALRQATNFPVQSLASWICLIGLRLLDDYFMSESDVMEGHILMQVHDSITSEIKLVNTEDAGNQRCMDVIKRDVKNIMELDTKEYIKDVFGVNINVPLVFDIGYKERWS